MGSMRRPETSVYTTLRHVITKEIEESNKFDFWRWNGRYSRNVGFKSPYAA